MHIEPGVVDGAKIALSHATAAGAFGLAARMVANTVRTGSSVAAVAVRSVIATGLVLSFFEILPHHPVGVSEVHLILGSTLFLVLGAGPAAIGLALGLLLQGVLYTPSDLPQYGMNVTTLLVPLFAMSMLARRIIPENTAYTDISYWQTLSLSTAFQAGIVVWVGFWALYGQGATAENLANIAAFGAAYAAVLVIEPLADLAILALAKSWRTLRGSPLVEPRLYRAAH